MSEYCFRNQGAGRDGVGLKLNPRAQAVEHLHARRMQPVMGQLMECYKEALSAPQFIAEKNLRLVVMANV
jgi:hypothetical protein